jgi:hypothetical protein
MGHEARRYAEKLLGITLRLTSSVGLSPPVLKPASFVLGLNPQTLRYPGLANATLRDAVRVR